eukprot:15104193-Alexandrium_andersonii.AAC.1
MGGAGAPARGRDCSRSWWKAPGDSKKPRGGASRRPRARGAARCGPGGESYEEVALKSSAGSS